MVRALPHGSDTRIDFGRIAAIAAAIAVHAAALLMLLMPMAAPPLATPTKPKITIEWYDKKKVEPTPVEAEIVEKMTPKPAEPSPVVQRQPDTQVVDVPIVVDTGSERVVDIATPAIDSGNIGGAIEGAAGPLPSATLEYVRATSPRYPVNELRNNIQGTVILRVLVDVDGKPVDVTIETSSGNRNLDKEARQHVLKTWRFKPAMQNGQAVQAYGLVPIAFNLQ